MFGEEGDIDVSDLFMYETLMYPTYLCMRHLSDLFMYETFMCDMVHYLFY